MHYQKKEIMVQAYPWTDPIDEPIGMLMDDDGEINYTTMSQELLPGWLEARLWTSYPRCDIDGEPIPAAYPPDCPDGTLYHALTHTINSILHPGEAIIQDSSLMIKKDEEWLNVRQGDWIIKGVTDEIYPCNAVIFERTYTPGKEPGSWVKKPVIIKAFQWQTHPLSTETRDEVIAKLPEWIDPEKDLIFENSSYFIKTLEGIAAVNLEDWVIQGVNGELYPCGNPVFQATYTPVKE